MFVCHGSMSVLVLSAQVFLTWGQTSISNLHKCYLRTARALRKDKSEGRAVGNGIDWACCLPLAAVPVRCTSLEACESDPESLGLDIMAAAQLQQAPTMGQLYVAFHAMVGPEAIREVATCEP